MDEPEPRRDLRLPPVLYWLCVLAFAVALGVAAPALFLLGFWESIPFLLVATWIAGRLFPRPVPPLPPRDGR